MIFSPRLFQGAGRWETGNEVVFAYCSPYNHRKRWWKREYLALFSGTVFKGLRFLLSTRLAMERFQKRLYFRSSFRKPLFISLFGLFSVRVRPLVRSGSQLFLQFGIFSPIIKITISSTAIGLKKLLFSTNSLAKLLSDSSISIQSFSLNQPITTLVSFTNNLRLLRRHSVNANFSLLA